jgi:hypothetical protein
MLRHQLAIALSLFLVSCWDLDPLGIGERHVLGDYSLEQWVNGTRYYLINAGHAEPGGVLEGSVERIGWNDRHILAWRGAMSGQDGWMIVDTELGTITGPMDDTGLRRHPEVRGVDAIDAGRAWNRLPPNRDRLNMIIVIAVALAVTLIVRSIIRHRRRPPPGTR